MFDFSIDVTSQDAIQGAANAFNPGRFNPKQIFKVIENYLTQKKGGSVWWNLTLESSEGKIYRIPEKCIKSGNDKNNKEQYAYKELQNMLILMGAAGNPQKQTVNIKEWMNGEFVDVPQQLPVFADTIGKPIGAIVRFYRKYPNSYAINGYTNNPIPDRLADPEGYEKTKELPTTIWMPNYSKEPQAVFETKLYFHPETEKTLKELQNDNEDITQEVDAMLAKVLKMNSDAIKLENKKWDELRLKELKKRLKYFGEDFNSNMFQPSTDLQDNSGTDTAVDDVSFDSFDFDAAP